MRKQFLLETNVRDPCSTGTGRPVTGVKKRCRYTGKVEAHPPLPSRGAFDVDHLSRAVRTKKVENEIPGRVERGPPLRARVRILWIRRVLRLHSCGADNQDMGVFKGSVDPPGTADPVNRRAVSSWTSTQNV